MPSTYCNHINKGLFVSHQGMSLCCVNHNKHKNIKPSEFWKGAIRKNALASMNEGRCVEGCDICYRTEAKKMPSARTFANLYDDLPVKDLPTLLDIDLSNFCNLKCVMCNPTRSSEWAKDLNLPVSSVTKEIIEDLASISGDLQHLTIQGGEPTIMKEYEYYFELLASKDVPKHVDLQIITNATNINKKFYSMLSDFRSVRLSVSVDAYGMANDYIRWPSKFTQIEKNLIKISDLEGNFQVELFNSLNILSMFNYYDFLKWCRNMQDVYDSKAKTLKIIPMKVQNPKKYSPFIAPQKLKDKFTKDVKKFMEYSDLTNSNWRTEMLLLVKQINAHSIDNNFQKELKDNILKLDKKRNCKITDFIPQFNSYFS